MLERKYIKSLNLICYLKMNGIEPREIVEDGKDLNGKMQYNCVYLMDDESKKVIDEWDSNKGMVEYIKAFTRQFRSAKRMLYNGQLMEE